MIENNNCELAGNFRQNIFVFGLAYLLVLLLVIHILALKWLIVLSIRFFIENIILFQENLLDAGNHIEVIGSIKLMGLCF